MLDLNLLIVLVTDHIDHMSRIYISWKQNSNFMSFRFLPLNAIPLEHENIELQNNVLQKDRSSQDKNERHIEW